MDTGIGKGLLEIAMALIAVALVALLVNRSSDTTRIVSTAGSTFNTLLQTISLQNGMGTGMSGF